MTPAELRAAITAAGDSTVKLREVIRAAASVLRSARTDDPIGIAVLLAPFAEHHHRDVRLEVACAFEYFPPPRYEAVATRLVKDSDRSVRDNARQAVRRRAEQTREFLRHQTKDDVARELLDEIEKTHGKAARRRATRLSSLQLETFFSQFSHEAARTLIAIYRELAALRTDSERLEPARSAKLDALSKLYDRLSGVIRRSREAVRRFRPVFRNECLRDVVAHALDALRDRASVSGVTFRSVVDVNANLRLDLDRDALLQALENVLNNAIEARRADAELQITVRARLQRKGARVVLQIKDSGIGMSEEQLSQGLFVPFATAKPGGMGFGLYGVRQMVEEVHGGELSVRSGKDGTTVSILLPVRQNQPRR